MIRNFLVLLVGAGLVACSSARSTLDADEATKAVGRLDSPGGFVSATVASFSPDAPPIASMAATFWDEPRRGAGSRCSVRQSGACSVRPCEAGDAPKAIDSG